MASWTDRRRWRRRSGIRTASPPRSGGPGTTPTRCTACASGWPRRRWRRRLAARKSIDHGYRMAWASWDLVLLLGLATIPLPGPGWLTVIGGLFILATEFLWAERLLEFTKRHVKRWTDWVTAQPVWVRVLLGLATAAFVYGVVVVILRVFGVPDWVPDWVPLWRQPAVGVTDGRVGGLEALSVWKSDAFRAIGAVVARFVHTEEVTGSNPVSPTAREGPGSPGGPGPSSFRAARGRLLLDPAVQSAVLADEEAVLLEGLHRAPGGRRRPPSRRGPAADRLPGSRGVAGRRHPGWPRPRPRRRACRPRPGRPPPASGRRSSAAPPG